MSSWQPTQEKQKEEGGENRTDMELDPEVGNAPVPTIRSDGQAEDGKEEEEEAKGCYSPEEPAQKSRKCQMVCIPNAAPLIRGDTSQTNQAIQPSEGDNENNSESDSSLEGDTESSDNCSDATDSNYYNVLKSKGIKMFCNPNGTFRCPLYPSKKKKDHILELIQHAKSISRDPDKHLAIVRYVKCNPDIVERLAGAFKRNLNVSQSNRKKNQTDFSRFTRPPTTVHFSNTVINKIVTSKAFDVEVFLQQFNNREALNVDLDTESKTVEGPLKQKIGTLQLCIDDQCLIFQIINADRIPKDLISFLKNSNAASLA